MTTIKNDPTNASRGGLARDLLMLYRAFGIDDAISDEPVDWLARGDVAPGAGFRLDDPKTVARDEARVSVPPRREAPDAAPAGTGEPRGRTRPDLTALARPAPSPTSTGMRQFPTASPDEAVMAARESAGQAQSLAELRERLESFNGCALKATAKNLCFFRGVERTRLMLIGEAPGRDEDLAGIPFVGPAGRLLDKMLAGIGLTEKDVHITNSVYWRPPGNRTPSTQETQACRPFLDRQIELVAPDFIVLLGGAAANIVLGVEGGIMRLRGNWNAIQVGGRRVRVMPTLHPAFLLRSPAHKRQAWRDILAVAEALEKQG